MRAGYCPTLGIAIHSLGSQHEDANVTNDAPYVVTPRGDKVYTAHSTGIDLLDGLSNMWEKSGAFTHDRSIFINDPIFFTDNYTTP